MASRVDAENSPLFKERKKEGYLVVHDAPKFSFDAYINEYEGRTKLDRLRLIGLTSTYFAFVATVQALQIAKKLGDVAAYVEIADNLHKLKPSAKDLAAQPKDVQEAPDKGWVERRSKQIQAETDRLEAELKIYRNNMIKESIRMGQEELGQHYYNAGDYVSSGKAYGKMRDFCTTQKHVADMTLRLIFVNIAQRNWSSVSSYCTKLQTVSVKTEERERLFDVGNVCQGLACLANGSYQSAAEDFMRVSPNYLLMEPVGGISFQRAVASGNDVAVYGGLCALASMDRRRLQERVLNNGSFRQFLELEPHIRRAISAFVQSKYTACLAILDSYRTDYLLDVHLTRHFDDIYGLVRSKSMVEYFIPFSTVTLAELAKAFPPRGPGQHIEDELIVMIQRGLLDARVDMVDKLLVAPTTVPRTQVQQNALALAKKYEKALRLRLLRANMGAAGLELPASKGNKGGAAAQAAMMDLMGEESFVRGPGGRSGARGGGGGGGGSAKGGGKRPGG